MDRPPCGDPKGSRPQGALNAEGTAEEKNVDDDIPDST